MPDGEHPDGEPVAAPHAWWFRATVIVGVAAGITLRVWLLRLPTGALDSDEAIVGLMARHMVHQHEFTTFYWGQNYGGSGTAMVMAAVFAVFGSSTATLKAVPIGMSAISALLVWRLGRRTIGEPGATIAGLAFWVWPTDYVWLSTKERGFYWACLILGLAFLLAVLRLVDRPDAVRDWILLGFLGGVGWWTSPQILYFVVPGLIWLVFKLRREQLQLAVPFGFAVLGSLPWFIWNMRNDWAAFVPASHQFDKGYIGNIKVLFRHGLPVALGLNVIERWLVPVVFPIIYIVIVVGGTIALVRAQAETVVSRALRRRLPAAVGSVPGVGRGRRRPLRDVPPAHGACCCSCSAARHPRRAGRAARRRARGIGRRRASDPVLHVAVGARCSRCRDTRVR